MAIFYLWIIKKLRENVKEDVAWEEPGSVFVGLYVKSDIDGDKLKVGDVKPSNAYIIFSSHINPNGNPELKRSYTINLEIKGRERYSQRRYGEGRYFKVYNYGYSIDEVLDKVSDKMSELKGLESKDGLKLTYSGSKFAKGGVPDNAKWEYPFYFNSDGKEFVAIYYSYEVDVNEADEDFDNRTANDLTPDVIKEMVKNKGERGNRWEERDVYDFSKQDEFMDDLEYALQTSSISPERVDYAKGGLIDNTIHPYLLQQKVGKQLKTIKGLTEDEDRKLTNEMLKKKNQQVSVNINYSIYKDPNYFAKRR